MALTSPDRKFRPDIEGLRAIAILLVVAYHTGLSAISGGFIGVDVFFVISGYVISQVIVNEIRATGRFDFVAFYARRARRLLPASTLMIMATMVTGTLLLSPLENKELAKAALAAVLFGSNIWFLFQASDYFASDVALNPVLHTWSLGVEEQFYLVWPVLIFIVVRYVAPQRRQTAFLAMVSAVSLIACVRLTSEVQPIAFFGMPTRAWQFGVGACALLMPAGPRRFSRALGWLGFLIILVAAVTITKDSPFPGTLALAPTAGAGLILLAGKTAMPSGVEALLASVPMQFVGRLSYSWYLWHWPVLVFTAVAFPDPSVLQTTGAVVGSFAIALVTHRLVENPIRFNLYLIPRRVTSLACASVLVVGAALVLHRFYAVSKQAMETPSQRLLAAAAIPSPKYWECGVSLTADAQEIKECVFGEVSSPDTVVLFGDSHAGQWLPAFDEIATARHLRLVTLLRYLCPVSAMPAFNSTLKREYTECETWRNLALDRIRELHPILIVAGQIATYRRASPDKWREGTRATYARLSAMAAAVVMLRDNPIPDRNLLTCLSRAKWHGSGEESCAFTRDGAVRTEVFEQEKQAVEGLAHVAVIDMTEQICDAAVCLPERGDVVIYRDSNHLSEAYVKTLAPALDRKLFRDGRVPSAPIVK